MKKLAGLLAVVLIPFLFFQCQRNLGYIGAADPSAPVLTLAEPIQASLQGNIVDENNLPAPDVLITVGSKNTTTNTSGYFRISDASLDKNSSLVLAEKGGYFKAYRVFSATSGTNQVKIKLVKKILAATFSSAAGGAATLANGAKVSIPANGVVEAASGLAYTGDVKIYAAYIDPVASDIAETVPGSFMANDVNGNRVVLASYGMLAVELESAGGLKLQIKTGFVATLASPIPSSLQASATSSIPMWYVNEKTGIWQEEGTATRQGTNMVADVRHFSYWNYDYKYDAVSLTFQLKNADDLPLVHVRIRVTSNDGGGSAHGYSDSLGQMKGAVPANKNLLLEIFDPCGNPVYSKSLGPLSKATDLGTITVSTTTPALLTFKGRVVDCSNQPVKKGYVMINFNHGIRYAPTNGNGEYAVSFVVCAGTPATAEVIAIDQTAQQQSLATAVAITAPTTSAGTIAACGTSSVQFINYTLDNIDYKISSTASDSILAFSQIAGNINFMGIRSPGTTNYITFVVRNATTSGTYPLGEMAVQTYRKVILKTPFNIVLSNFPKAAGQFYEGSFTGQFTADSSTTVHNITTTFKVRRN
ncbi:MAG: hypothetical protein ABI151_00690 [Chitinophagaceae bacterium]